MFGATSVETICFVCRLVGMHEVFSNMHVCLISNSYPLQCMETARLAVALSH